MLNFKTELTDVGGDLIVTGQTIPTFCGHDPLAQIWSKVKSRIEELYGVKPCATISRPAPEITIISAFPNWAYHEQKCPEEDKRIYARRFSDTFELQMQELEEAILSWVDDDEFGLHAYERILRLNSPIIPMSDTNQVIAELELLTDDFLVKKGLRRPNRTQRKRDYTTHQHS